MSKVVVITGGTRGIGKSLVDIFLANNYYVASFSSNVKNTFSLKKQYGENSHLYVETFNVKEEQKGRNFVKKVIERWGKIDVYIFNSGISEDKTFSKMTRDQWRNVIETNLIASFDITQEVFNHMKNQSGMKKMFFMTSLAGLEGSFGQANYSASKAALIGLSNSLALEGAKYNIKVNAISPAALTDMTEPIVTSIQNQCLKENCPFPKYWKIGTPQEVSEMLFILSNSDNLETGQIFAINGHLIDIYQPFTKKEYDLILHQEKV